LIDWQGYFDELVANIRTAWPEVKTTGGGGIHDRNSMERISQEKIARFPYCVVDLASAPSADWGLNNSAFEVRCEVHYIALLEIGMAQLRTKLDMLRHQVLRPSAWTTCTVLDCEELTLSTGDEAMGVFLQKNMPFLAGKCVFVMVLQEVVTDTPP
jgi:hypothetical protein